MQAQILVPLDGTPRAEAILATIIPLARATGAGLTLVEAMSADIGVDPLVGMRLPPEITEERLTTARQAIVAYLREIAHRLERPGWLVRTTVLEGEPAGAILNYVAQHPEVRLIAMATHGRRGINRWLFGSTAEEILREAPVPLLLLRLPTNAPPSGPEPVFRNIVVPLDGSTFAECALEQAKALAQATGARLVLVTAVEGVDDANAATEEIPEWIRQERQAEIDQMVLYQQDLAARIEAEGIKVGVQIGDGRPADEILNLSEEVNADLIVMATHGRTGFQRFRLGCVALEVVEHATRPVFLVRVQNGQVQPAELAGAGAGAARGSAARIDHASAGTH